MIFKTPPENFNPKNSIVACFIECGNEVLFLQRAEHCSHGGTWCIPGGKVEGTETLFEAIKREVTEETGIILEAPQFLKTVYIRFAEYDFVYHMFLEVFANKPTVILEMNESKAYKWLTKQEVIDLENANKLLIDEMPCINEIYGTNEFGNGQQYFDRYKWRPSAQLPALQARAKMLNQIRKFFAERNVLEVETPLMCGRSITDPYIQPFKVGDNYLQTSPEYAMKRLVAAGSGSIYQVCKAFRREEAGNFHNPEFTMLEWYRIGFDHKQLMDEVDQLLQTLLETNQPAIKRSYHELFNQFVGINPHTANIDQLQGCADQHNINLSANIVAELSVTDWLQLIMSHVIEPQLQGDLPWIIYDFPAPQAALAKVIQAEVPVAARFEVYMQGVELANGYYELLETKEHIQRFENDNIKRAQINVDQHELDERLLAALDYGMPDCAGIALGLDRVLMLKFKAQSISDVLSFTINNA